MSKAAIVTMYAGEAAIVRPVTLPALKRYAAMHGYTIEHASPVAGLHPSWGKVPALQRAIEDHDVAVWIDADALVTDLSRDILDDVSPHAFQALAHDPRFGPSACIWVVRRTRQAKSFLDAVRRERHRDHPGWEQGAIHTLLKDDAGLGRGTALLGHEWSDPEGVCQAPRIIHCGYQAGDYGERAEALRAGGARRATVS